MVHVIVRHQVKDYAAWKPVFDAHRGFIEQGGMRSFRLFRGTDNPNEIVIDAVYDDLARAKAFYADPQLHQAMSEAGVIGAPEVVYLDLLDIVELGAPATKAA